MLDECYDFLYDRELKDNEFSFSHGRLNRSFELLSILSIRISKRNGNSKSISSKILNSMALIY